MRTQTKFNILQSVAFLVFFGTFSLNPIPDTTSEAKVAINEPQEDYALSRYEVTHATEVWISTLEWCESRGRGVDAINPNDSDGTPSYYHFQFKPTTFKYYVVKYGLALSGLEDEDYWNLMTDYETTREVVRAMTLDSNVRFEKEFPMCVKMHGFPPKY